MSRTMFRTHDATQAAAPHDRRDVIGRLGAHMTRLMADEEGMSTAEYAIGTIAAAAFGAILYTVVTESQDRLSSCRSESQSSTAASHRTEPAYEQAWIDNEPIANDWQSPWAGPWETCSSTTTSQPTGADPDPSTNECWTCFGTGEWAP